MKLVFKDSFPVGSLSLYEKLTISLFTTPSVFLSPLERHFIQCDNITTVHRATEFKVMFYP